MRHDARVCPAAGTRAHTRRASAQTRSFTWPTDASARRSDARPALRPHTVPPSLVSPHGAIGGGRCDPPLHSVVVRASSRATDPCRENWSSSDGARRHGLARSPVRHDCSEAREASAHRCQVHSTRHATISTRLSFISRRTGLNIVRRSLASAPRTMVHRPLSSPRSRVAVAPPLHRDGHLAPAELRWKYASRVAIRMEEPPS